MNVLSLFDGMSCGQIALDRAGIAVDKYYASEIKPCAIDLVQKRYPNTIQLGDVREIDTLPDWIDLLIGGSPCQGISRLNQNQEGLQHNESVLFWEFVRLLNLAREVNQNVYFLLENTPGKKEATNAITKELKRLPIKFNSAWVSAQNRPRLYWTNIPVNSLPKRLHLTTKDVFDEDMPDDLLVSEGRVKWLTNTSGIKSIDKGYTRVNPYPKSGCLTAKGHIKWNCNYLLRDGKYRVLSIRELERLQTLPEGYCDGLTYEQAYDLIGDGWTIDIVSHIFRHLPKYTH
jgi:DNA (cytosine-5)-methyltransferase 3A